VFLHGLQFLEHAPMFCHMALKIAVADPTEESFLVEEMRTKKPKQLVSADSQFSNPYTIAPTFVNLRPKFIYFLMLGIDFRMTNREVIAPLDQVIDGLVLHLGSTDSFLVGTRHAGLSEFEFAIPNVLGTGA
jgi:hypothetical protein